MFPFWEHTEYASLRQVLFSDFFIYGEITGSPGRPDFDSHAEIARYLGFALQLCLKVHIFEYKYLQFVTVENLWINHKNPVFSNW